MNAYKVQINGRSSTLPVLEHEFEIASDTMAKDYTRRIIPLIASENYINFELFCVEGTGHHVASFLAEQSCKVLEGA